MHLSARKSRCCLRAAALLLVVPSVPASAQLLQPSAVVTRTSALTPVVTSSVIEGSAKKARPYVLAGAVVGAVAAVALFARPVYEAEFAPAWIVYGGVALVGAGVGAVVGRLVFDTVL